ncbi:MAG: PD-(D/E)XK nuclease family protein [Candidatus Didemnitutus sp.]|nr:PD-(D/E)XK nuclease family protein [Candidatus Didemnitutus sp.]
MRRHFLTWQSPLLPQAVAWLAREWRGDGPLDLSHAAVVVPTRQAGRRLRAGLAEHVATHRQAVFPPRVLTPEALLAPAENSAVAAALPATLAWTRVLQEIDLGEFRAVFPVDPPSRNFAWAFRLARELLRLQAALAEEALTLADVVARMPVDFGERERWRQLAELGRLHAGALAARGLREPQAARIVAATAPAPLDGVDRIVVLATPDPLPLALTALAEHARRVPVEIAIFAPESEAENFDAWGRPRAEAWARRTPPFADFAREVHLLADAAAQAEEVARVARLYPQPDGQLAIGLADAALVALTENALERVGVAAFNPAGELHSAEGFHHFLVALAAFAAEPTFARTLAFARAPETLAWLAEELGEGFSAAAWLEELDALHAAHLPATLADARRHARSGVAARGLTRLAEARDESRRGGFAAGVEAVLGRMFAARRLDLARAEDRRFAAAAQTWSEVVRECAEAEEKFPHVAREDWWEIALQRFGEQPRDAEKPTGAVELQGWLELPFEDAPHVLVAGMNDGAVPKAVVGDVFLPETLRALLGLKTNAERFACDAYLVHALVASRREGGRVDVLLGKVSAAGDPLKPSRLLLRCEDAELPRRVAHLFRELGAEATLPAWERAWRLTPRRVPPPRKLSPTAFRSYLACPFRFYLKHALKMEAFDAAKRELDVFDFGRLCHTPLEKFAAAPWRDCTDERALAAMLVEEFDRAATARYGEAPTLPIVAQLESARQRLRWAAKVQARERADGWVIHAIERDFAVEFGGLELRGRIDRIDRHESSGAWRVLDYKTSDTAKTPVEAHLDTPWAHAPEWARLSVEGRERQWTDLQLPLYLHALPAILPEATARAACGYFNLPKAASATALALWGGYSIELHESALRCAEGVVAAVRAGNFWPPNEELRAESDDFASLFHRGVAASVAGFEPNAEGAP